nr:MAG TPA: hypothetical protein [Caudoviricetes sp.]
MNLGSPSTDPIPFAIGIIWSHTYLSIISMLYDFRVRIRLGITPAIFRPFCSYMHQRKRYIYISINYATRTINKFYYKFE